MELWIKGMTPVWHLWMTPTSITKACTQSLLLEPPLANDSFGSVSDLLPMPRGQEHPGKVFLLESKATINLECVTQAIMTMNCTKLRPTFPNSSLKLCNKSSGG